MLPTRPVFLVLHLQLLSVKGYRDRFSSVMWAHVDNIGLYLLRYLVENILVATATF